jgi:hypothetical protein
MIYLFFSRLRAPLALAALLSACAGDGARDIRDYYFPLRELTDGLVYEYRPVDNDTFPPLYWYFRSIIFKDSAFLVGTFYEYDLLPRQFVREELVSNGVRLRELILYEIDTTGGQRPMPADIVAGDVFPFRVRPQGGIFLFNVRWSPPGSEDTRFTLVKNRRYLGDTTFVYEGRKRPAVRFEVRELLEHEQEGVLEKEYAGVEIYAKNLGLVYFRKDIAEGLSLAYRLAARYPMAELERQFLEMYGPR